MQHLNAFQIRLHAKFTRDIEAAKRLAAQAVTFVCVPSVSLSTRLSHVFTGHEYSPDNFAILSSAQSGIKNIGSLEYPAA
jgi:hypothetical protein